MPFLGKAQVEHSIAVVVVVPTLLCLALIRVSSSWAAVAVVVMLIMRPLGSEAALEAVL